MAERAQIISTAISGHKLSREEQRKERELEAARKAGTAPAALDEQGKPINPHIPDYISRAPWYAATGTGPSLAHQRKPGEATNDDPVSKLEQWYDRGARAGPAAKKYRKGACENCGAMTHKRQDCVERPRRRGAKFTNKDIMADEVIQEIHGDYDGKRDRWNGYDNSQYRVIVEEYEAMEEARRKAKEADLDNQTSAPSEAANPDQPAGTAAAAGKKEKKLRTAEDDEFGSSDEDEDDDEKYAEAAEQVGQKLDEKNRITVRNLRIREDTAKYLINLNPESAYYDPKTRAMRDAPEQNGSQADMKFAGDNFLRYSGEATNMQKLQMFAWQSAQRGHNVHVQANPTAGEMLHREFQEKKEVLKDTSKVSILAKYGGEEHLERMPKELLGGQTEEYVEYSRTGQVIKGREKAKARSKYDEDVFPNNHKSVWGSWYDRDSGSWGFACCHSLISGSYCTGDAGKVANASSSVTALLDTAAERRRIDAEAEAERQAAKKNGESSAPYKWPSRRDDAEDDNGDVDRTKEREQLRSSKAADASIPTYGKKRVGEGEDLDIDKDRLKRALAEEKKRKAMGEDEAWQQTKKGKTDVTQEEMEAYRLSRQAFDDPMANYKDPDE